MAKNSIDLEKVRVRYDQKDGAFRITSADPRLRGKPFLITLSRDSEAVNSLLQVFRDEEIIGADSSLPGSAVFPAVGVDYGSTSVDEYTIAGATKPLHQDSRLILPVGATYGDRSVTIDLSYSSGTLIAGAPATGKTELLVALAQHALIRGNDVRLLDPIGEGLNRRIPSLPRESYGEGVEDSERVIRGLLKELRERLDLLEVARLGNSVDYESRISAMAPILLFADSLEDIPSSHGLYQLLVLGRTVGIYVFTTVLSAQSLESATGSLLPGFDRRILLGDAPLSEFDALLNERPGFSPRLLSGRGRGVLKTREAEPIVVQFLRSVPEIALGAASVYH